MLHRSRRAGVFLEAEAIGRLGEQCRQAANTYMKSPSTRTLDDLPSIDDLIRLSKGLAMLDAILSPEWEYRYYSFNSKWLSGEMMASMRDGSGDGYFILFDKNGAAIKGFAHEAIMSPWNTESDEIWPGMYDSVPDQFSSFLNEPAFSMADVTFCIWRRYLDAAWQCGVNEFPEGDDPDGSEEMLKILDGDPATYQEFARDYYEVEIPLAAIEHVYANLPLNERVIRSLNAELSYTDVEPDINEIAYPIAAA
jgi:hypothetical protein